MQTVTLNVRSLNESLADVAQTWKKGIQSEAQISFATPELLWQVLTAKRWEILKAMTGAGVISIREVARRVERDVKAVHADIHALLDAGILEKTDGGVQFPYDSVHIDFMLDAA